MSTNEADCIDNLIGLNEQQLKTLADWETKFQQKYGQVGRVVPPKELTLQALAGHDGSDPDKPLYLAIQGVIFDVSKGMCGACMESLASQCNHQGASTMGQMASIRLPDASVHVRWQPTPLTSRIVWTRWMTWV